MNQQFRFTHTGWDAYYRERQGERAWNGVPDEFLLENLAAILVPGATTVLDVAAGDGRNSEPFLQRDLTVLATDLSAAGLANFLMRSRLTGGRKPVVMAGDFLSMHWVPEQFDCIVCFNSLPHFEAPADALHLIATLLASGGRAAFNAFTPGDVAYGVGEKVGENRYHYRDTLFTFMTEDDVKAILPSSVEVIKSETRRWQEPDHGSYRRGSHTHEACFFIIEKNA
jgi:SAM-dependent methyltransferase